VEYWFSVLGFSVLGFFVLLFVLFGLACFAFTRLGDTDVNELNPDSESEGTNLSSPLRWLPFSFYVIASLNFAGWIITALNLESWEAFGIGIGSTITCLAFGRVIELLQIIAEELYRKRLSESP